MFITPDSTVILYSNVPISQGQPITFATPQGREAYFAALASWQETPCTYVKHTGRIQTGIPITAVEHANYLSIQNSSHEGRIWYCLLTDWEYVNNETTLITFVVDPYTTYLFDYKMTADMISRMGLSAHDWDLASANPYRDDVIPLTTAEDLVSDTSLEKIYHIRKYTDGTETDGKYIISSTSVNTNEAFDHDMGNHIMAVFFIAPIDFYDYGNMYYASDEWWKLRKAISNSLTAYASTVSEGYNQRLTSEHWTAMTAQLQALWEDAQYNVPSGLQEAYTTAFSTQPAQGGLPDPGSCAGAFDLFNRTSMTSGSNAAYQQWADILTSVQANGYYYGVSNEYMGTNKSPYSAMPRAYNIIAIDCAILPTGTALIDTLINFLTQYNAISQIIGVYGIEKTVFEKAFWGGNGLVPSLNDFLTNFYEVQTSYQRANGGLETARTSPKLYRSPYSYMRLITPNNDIKEYTYEDFVDQRTDPTALCKFRLMGDLNGRPSIIIAPVRYKELNGAYSYTDEDTGTISDMSDVINTNLKERVEYIDFAQLPYVTDAYLTYLSQQVMSVTQANTLDAQDQRAFGKLTAAVGAVGAVIGGGAKALSGAGEGYTLTDSNGVVRNIERSWQAPSMTAGAAYAGAMVGGGIATGVATAGIRSTEAQIAEADKWLNSGGIGNEIDYGRYNDTKPAFANNLYHPGTNGGIYQYLKGNANTIDFILVHVQLNQATLARYERYFRYFGYNYAGMSGFPIDYQYTHGGQAENQPHWEQLDDGRQGVYVQMMSCHVYGIPRVYAQAIETMYKQGVRFIKGD